MWPLEHTQVDDGLGTITEVQQLFEHLFLLFFNEKKMIKHLKKKDTYKVYMYTKIKIQDSTEKKIVRSTFIIYELTNIIRVISHNMNSKQL